MVWIWLVEYLRLSYQISGYLSNLCLHDVDSSNNLWWRFSNRYWFVNIVWETLFLSSGRELLYVTLSVSRSVNSWRWSLLHTHACFLLEEERKSVLTMDSYACNRRMQANQWLIKINTTPNSMIKESSNNRNTNKCRHLKIALSYQN